MMKGGLRAVAAFCLTLGSAIPAAGYAQMKSTDVAGVNLGMSVDETTAALKKALGPNAQIKVQNTFAKDVFLPESPARIVGESANKEESMQVLFTRATGRAFHISRQVKKPNYALISEISKALSEKYGPPTAPSTSNNVLWWRYDVSDHPTKSLLCPMASVGDTQKPTCGTAMDVTISPEITATGKSAASSGFKVVLWDGRLTYLDTLKYTEMSKAHNAGVEKAVANNKPKL